MFTLKGQSHKRRKRRKSGPPTLIRMLALSFLAHVLLLYLIPSVNLFTQSSQYIEVETVLLEKPETESALQTEITPRQAPAESPQVSAETPHVPTTLKPREPEVREKTRYVPERDMSRPEQRVALPKPSGVTRGKAVQIDESLPSELSVDAVMRPAKTSDDHAPREINTSVVTEYDDVVMTAETLKPEPHVPPEETEAPAIEDILPDRSEFPKRSAQDIPPLSSGSLPRTVLEHRPVVPDNTLPVDSFAKTAMPAVRLPETSASFEDDLVTAIQAFPSSPIQEEEPPSDKVFDRLTMTPHPLARIVSDPVPPEPGEAKTLLRQTPPQHPVESPDVSTPVHRKRVFSEVSRRQERVPAFQNLSALPLPEMTSMRTVAVIPPPEKTPMPLVLGKDLSRESLRDIPTVIARKPLIESTEPSLKSMVLAEDTLVKKEDVRLYDRSIVSPPTPSIPEDVLFPPVQADIPRPRPSATPGPVQLFTSPQTAALQKRHVSPEPALRVLQQSAPQRAALLGREAISVAQETEGWQLGILAAKEEVAAALDTEKEEPAPEDVIEHALVEHTAEDAEVLSIEGPAARREILYKPPRFPDVRLDMDVSIRLKFWVLPDGTIGEVIPLQRGDIRLERAAIEYLKSWRFTPVTPDSPEAWGVVPIRYTLR